MIKLYHCAGARSFRALWALEEMGLAYELVMMPFPPRSRFENYHALNPLGTVPVMFDGEARMTESSAMPHYLGTAERSRRICYVFVGLAVLICALAMFQATPQSSDATLNMPIPIPKTRRRP